MPDTLEQTEVIREGRSSDRRPARPEMLSRARSAILTGLILFVVAQIGMRGAIEQYHPELRDPTFEIKFRQYTRLKSQFPQPPATVMFMGSSITAHGSARSPRDRL